MSLPSNTCCTIIRIYLSILRTGIDRSACKSLQYSITEEDISRAIKALNPGKATDNEGIAAEHSSPQDPKHEAGSPLVSGCLSSSHHNREGL